MQGSIQQVMNTNVFWPIHTHLTMPHARTTAAFETRETMRKKLNVCLGLFNTCRTYRGLNLCLSDASRTYYRLNQTSLNQHTTTFQPSSVRRILCRSCLSGVVVLVLILLLLGEFKHVLLLGVVPCITARSRHHFLCLLARLRMLLCGIQCVAYNTK